MGNLSFKNYKIYLDYFKRYSEFFILPYFLFNNISRKSGLYELGFGWLNYGISLYIQDERKLQKSDYVGKREIE